jgi:hypothetical protein
MQIFLSMSVEIRHGISARRGCYNSKCVQRLANVFSLHLHVERRKEGSFLKEAGHDNPAVPCFFLDFK